MKKILIVIMIFIGAGTTSSWALAGLEDINFDGSLEVRGNSADNETLFGAATANGTNDHRGSTATRFRLGANMKVVDNVKGRLEVVRTPRQFGNAVTTVSGEESKIAFQNAYIEVEDLWTLRARLGRQYVGVPDDLVWNISPRNDDSLTASSIDGLAVTRAWGSEKPFIDLSLFTGKAVENAGIAQTDNTVAASSGDVNISAGHANLYWIPGGHIGLGLLYGVAENGPKVSDDNRLGIARIGVTGGIADDKLTYRAEFLQDFGAVNNGSVAGERLRYNGYAVDAGIGFDSKETVAGAFGLYANYLRGSGDRDTTDNDDKSFHDFNVLGVNTSDRLMGEIFGKSNTLAGGGKPLGQGLDSGVKQNTGLEVYNLGLKYWPRFAESKYSARADFFLFNRTERNQNSVHLGKKFGEEFDLTFGYDHSKHLGLEAGYAWLLPSDALTGVTAENRDNVTKLFARTTVKWGGEAR